MNKLTIFFVIAAFFAGSFAEEQEQEEEHGNVEKSYLVKYCNLLKTNGNIDEADVTVDFNEKNVVDLIDIAIRGNEVAKKNKPDDAESRQSTIEFFESAKQAWINVHPEFVPKVEQLPESADTPQVEQLPETGEIPKVEQLPETGDTPQVEQLPETGNIPQVEQLPAL